MHYTKILSSIFISTILAIGFSSCAPKQETPNPNKNINDGSNAAAISIVTGSQSLTLGESLPLDANFVDANGNFVVATNVTWTSSNTEVAIIENNRAVSVGSGQAVITGKAIVNGKEITSQIIIGVASSSAKPIFVVSPGVIIWSEDAGNIQLVPVYFGTSNNPNYSYATSKSSVIQVSSSGDVSFLSAGEAFITVTANGLEGKPTFKIPVLVLGELSTSVPLAVSRVTLNPVAATMFKGQTKTFTARAFNGSNDEITGNTITWEIENDTNNIFPNALSVNASGLVSASLIGNGILYATIKGIRAQAEIQVLPDTILIINPIYAEVSAGETKQYTADMYKVNRNDLSTSILAPPSKLTWKIEKLGDILPALSIFDIATVSQSGLVTVKSDASPGFSSIVEAFIPDSYIYGSSLVSVKFGTIPPGELPTTFPGSVFTFPGMEDF